MTKKKVARPHLQLNNEAQGEAAKESTESLLDSNSHAWSSARFSRGSFFEMVEKLERTPAKFRLHRLLPNLGEWVKGGHQCAQQMFQYSPEIYENCTIN